MRGPRQQSTIRAVGRQAHRTPAAPRANTYRALLVCVGVLVFAIAGCSSKKPTRTSPPELGHPTTTAENPAVGFFNTTTTLPPR